LAEYRIPEMKTPNPTLQLRSCEIPICEQQEFFKLAFVDREPLQQG
jgi:hypothetical protein